MAKQKVSEYANDKGVTRQAIERKIKSGKLKTRKCECGRTTYVIVESKKKLKLLNMIKIEIKNRFTGSVIFEYTKDNNILRDTVLEAIKIGADLRRADLSDADLSGADLRSANLMGADLRSANLSGANLSGADLSKRYISVSQIGSAKRMTTYCFEYDIIWCGCFTGTLEEFENEVKTTHEYNKQYLKEYLGFINYLKSLK